MSQIADYGALKKAVQGWIGRRDQITLDNIPMFINLAEKQIYRNLRIPAFESTITLLITPQGYISIPVDVLDFKHVYVGSESKDITVLRRVSLSELKSGGERLGFARTGTQLFFTSDVVKNFSEVTIVYYGDQQELVNDTDTNMVLTIAPDVILYGALSIAARFNNEEDEFAKWDTLYQHHIQQVDYQFQQLEYSGGAMVISPGGVCGNY